MALVPPLPYGLCKQQLRDQPHSLPWDSCSSPCRSPLALAQSSSGHGASGRWPSSFAWDAVEQLLVLGLEDAEVIICTPLPVRHI